MKQNKRSICQQYFLKFLMLERFNTYRLPNSDPVLGLDLRMNYDRDVNMKIYFKTVNCNFLVISRCFNIPESVE